MPVPRIVPLSKGLDHRMELRPFTHLHSTLLNPLFSSTRTRARARAHARSFLARSFDRISSQSFPAPSIHVSRLGQISRTFLSTFSDFSDGPNDSSISAEFKVTIKTRKDKVISSAVLYHKTAVLHTLLESRQSGPVITLRLNNLDPNHSPYVLADTARALWNALFPYFDQGRDAPEKLQVEVVLPVSTLDTALLSLGGIRDDTSYTLTRSALFQLFDYATASAVLPLYPHVLTKTNDVAHPLRPAKPLPSSEIYSRKVPHLGEYFKLHVAASKDLNTLHQWLNDERVDVFWQEKGSLEQHRAFLQNRTEDPHVLSVIGSYVELAKNDSFIPQKEDAATYSEIYWVKEDRLGPLMKDVRDYDRGLHMLVGSNDHRGPHRIRAWMPSLVHYCFTDEPRTQRVVCEPNNKNDKIIKYLESVGFERHGDVEFPHKTAALMIAERSRFYELCPF